MLLHRKGRGWLTQLFSYLFICPSKASSCQPGMHDRGHYLFIYLPARGPVVASINRDAWLGRLFIYLFVSPRPSRRKHHAGCMIGAFIYLFIYQPAARSSRSSTGMRNRDNHLFIYLFIYQPAAQLSRAATRIHNRLFIYLFSQIFTFSALSARKSPQVQIIYLFPWKSRTSSK